MPCQDFSFWILRFQDFQVVAHRLILGLAVPLFFLEHWPLGFLVVLACRSCATTFFWKMANEIPGSHHRLPGVLKALFSGKMPPGLSGIRSWYQISVLDFVYFFKVGVYVVS